MKFNWFDVNEVLPEDVMEHKEIKGGYLVTKKTDSVLVKFKNKTKSDKVQIIMGHRYYSVVNSMPNGGMENYKPRGWSWSAEWYSHTDSFSLDRDAEITHWAYIPKDN